MGWFLDGFRAEMPERMTNHRLTPYGYSLSEEFRRYIEEDAIEDARLTCEGMVRVDEAYRFPMRTALRALAGRGTIDQPYPFMAVVLYRVGCMGGDIDAACNGLGIVRPVRRPYVMVAL